MLRRFINSIYSSKKRYKICYIGLGYTGKTTLLYQLKLGEVGATIPTIGFNVEEVDIPGTTPGTSLSAVCWDLGLGCADIRMMMGLVKSVVDTSDAAVWFVDCTTVKDELDESLKAFQYVFMSDPESPLASMPVLILATKLDKVQNTTVLDDIRIKFSKALIGRTAPWFISGISLTENLGSPTSGVLSAFDWLRMTLESSSGSKRKLEAVPPTGPASPPIDRLSEKLESWLTRLSTDSPADEFLSQFHGLNLPSWDHYTHLRIAFHVLVKDGRQQGKNIIFDGIQKYIEQSPGTQTRKQTFHFTMTYFWIQMVHFGIRSTAPLTTVKTEIEVEGQKDDFGKFLVLNPYIAKSDLWNDYYSREVMMSKEAKEAMVLPDKKPLPNLVTQDLVDKIRMR